MIRSHYNYCILLLCGLSSIALSTLVMVGWYTQSVALIQINPAFAPMQFNSAVGFFLTGCSLLLVANQYNFLAKILSFIILIMGVMTLAEYVFDLDLYIDQLVFDHTIMTKTSHPGRMAPNTALSFTLAGLSLLSVLYKRPIIFGFVCAAFFLSISALIGYFTAVEGIYGWGSLTRMALHTSIGFVIVNVALMVYALQTSFLHKKIFGFWRVVPFSISIIVLVIAFVSSYGLHELTEVRNKEYFHTLILDTQDALNKRYQLYEQSLRGGLGLFYSSKFVGRKEWESYVKALNITTTLTGINGIGYIDSIKEEDLLAYLKSVKSDNASSFINHPDTEYSDKFIIKYIEPVDKNIKALGLDIGFEENRRFAAENARDTGLPTLTKKIELVQDNHKQAGFLLLIPVYKDQKTPNSIQLRRKQLLGWVYAPFIGKNFLSSLISVSDHQIDFEVYDGDVSSADTLIYASNEDNNNLHSAYKEHTKVNIAEQTWNIIWHTTDKFLPPGNNFLPKAVFLLGWLFSALLYYIFSRLVKRKEIIELEVIKRTALLAESESKNQAILHNTVDAIITINKQGQIETLNPAAEKMFGFQANEIVGQNIHLLIPDKDNFVEHYLSKSKAQIFDKASDVQALRSTGEFFPIQLSVSDVKHNGDQLLCCIIRDVTVQKKAEADLLSALSFQDLIMENIPDMIFIKNTDLDIIKFNHAFAALCLNENKTLIMSMSLPEQQETDYIAFNQGYYEAEEKFQLNDGKERIFFTKKVRFHNTDGDKFILGVSSDITQMVEQQEKIDFLKNLIIQSSEAATIENFLETVLEKICRYVHWPIGHAYIWDDESQSLIPSCRWYLEKNTEFDFSEFKKITETKRFLPGEGLPGSVYELAKPVWINDVAKHHNFPRNKLMKNINLHAAFGLPIIVNDKVKIVLEFFFPDSVEQDNSLFSFWEAAGTQLSRIIERNESEVARKKYTKELEEAKEIALRANIMKSEFLANMSHEIRTPLNGVIGGADLLKKTDITDNQKKYIQIISSSGDTLLALINDILDLSKIEVGEIAINPEEIIIHDFIADMLQTIYPKAKSKDVELVVNYEGQVPISIMADKVRLNQIFINLLGNAVKFVDSGYIAVSVEEISTNKSNVTLRLSVEDTGIGIAEENLEKIFDKFAQADASTTKKYGGTGLGLAITQRLIGLMNSQIHVKSQIGKGTTFWFDVEFPIVKQRNQQNAQYMLDQISSVKVLLIDNSPISTKFLSTFLTKMGIDHTKEDSIKKGYEKVLESVEQNMMFNFVLISQKILDIDCVNFAKEIRKNSDLGDIKLILLADHEKQEILDKNTKSLFNGILYKPFSLHDLRQKLYEVSILENGHLQKNTKEKDVNVKRALNARILLVENEIVNQVVATDMLESMGCFVDLAEDGQEALDIIKKVKNTHQYNIILMDCMMPVMDGFEATKKIREYDIQQSHEPHIIIAMTANAMSEERDKCLEAGMNDYLSKPVTEENLYRMLSKYIKK